LYFIIVFIILLVICYKYGDWRNWKLYYPTILYFIIGDLTLHILTDPKWLWAYQAWPFTIHLTWLFVVTCIYPCLVILYLTFFPKKFKFKILYTLLCIAIFTIYEYMMTLFGAFHYYNGWNLMYSIAFDFVMIPILYLHYKRPLVVWPISFALAFGFMFLFKIPF
jgi:hypothetical protein